MVTAIGQSGYARPFSQVKTISEQLPTALGRDAIKPKSAATRGPVPSAIAEKKTMPMSLKKLARMAAPRHKNQAQQSKKRCSGQSDTRYVHQISHVALLAVSSRAMWFSRASAASVNAVGRILIPKSTNRVSSGSN